MNKERSEDGQPKGNENVEGDDKHPSGKKEKRSGLGENYGQGVGYGGYSVEQDQAKSQTGTADHVKRPSDGG